jgi:hypothetical protein
MESSLEQHGSINILILPFAGCGVLLLSTAAGTIFTFLVSNFFCFSENHTNISSLWTFTISSKGKLMRLCLILSNFPYYQSVIKYMSPCLA